jgi:hypothetical protein
VVAKRITGASPTDSHAHQEINRKSTEGMNPINFDFVKSDVTETVERFLLQKQQKTIVIPVVLEYRKIFTSNINNPLWGFCYSAY